MNQRFGRTGMTLSALALIVACDSSPTEQPPPPPPPPPPPSITVTTSIQAPTKVDIGTRPIINIHNQANATPQGATTTLDSLQITYHLNGDSTSTKTIINPTTQVRDTIPHAHQENDETRATAQLYATATNSAGTAQGTNQATTTIGTEDLPEMMTVEFDTKYFFTQETNHTITVRVTHPATEITTEGDSNNGKITLQTPKSDSIIVTPIDQGKGIHKINGQEHQYTLGIAGGQCYTTDAYDESFTIPVTGERIQLHTVPTQVPILLAANTSGETGGRVVRTGPEPVTVNIRGSIVTVNRDQQHKILAILGPLQEPFLFLPLEEEQINNMNALYETVKKAFTHQNIPTPCIPYPNLEELVTLNFISTETFMEEYWNGIIGGAEPTSPGHPLHTHVFYHAIGNRASGSLWYDGNILSFVRSTTDTTMRLGTLISEFQMIGHRDARNLVGYCGHKVRGGSPENCHIRDHSGAVIGFNPEIMDPYVKEMTQDETAALVLAHTFGVATENTRNRNFALFKQEEEHWLQAQTIDNPPQNTLSQNKGIYAPTTPKGFTRTAASIYTPTTITNAPRLAQRNTVEEAASQTAEQQGVTLSFKPEYAPTITTHK